MNKTTVNIHGKEYETVASRVQRFRQKYGDAVSLITEIVYRDDNEVVMKASILGTDGNVVATGHAEEQRQSSSINRTSALENCETSAIGRALAAFGMAGTEYATADEVAQAISQQKAKPAVGSAKSSPVARGEDTQATPLQRRQLVAVLRGKGIEDKAMGGYLEREFGIVPGFTMTRADAANILEELRG